MATTDFWRYWSSCSWRFHSTEVWRLPEWLENTFQWICCTKLQPIQLNVINLLKASTMFCKTALCVQCKTLVGLQHDWNYQLVDWNNIEISFVLLYDVARIIQTMQYIWAFQINKSRNLLPIRLFLKPTLIQLLSFHLSEGTMVCLWIETAQLKAG